MNDGIQLKALQGPSGILLAWWHANKIAGCLGYAILRRVDHSDIEPLLAYVPFDPGHNPIQANVDGQPCTVWPYQRFTWTDYDPPAQGLVEYRAVAMTGAPQAPRQSDIVSAWIAADRPHFSDIIPYFNFGIVGSRWFSRALAQHPTLLKGFKAGAEHGKASKDKSARAGAPHKHDPHSAPSSASDAALGQLLAQPAPKTEGEVHPDTVTIGDILGGPLVKAMRDMFADTARDQTVEIYLALFELSEPSMLRALGALGKRCHLVLANGTHKNGADENHAAAETLKDKVDLTRRLLKGTETPYAHNKFVVFVKGGKAIRVWTGSTNFSLHGMFTQVNNGLMIEDADIAAAYYSEWQRLKFAGSVTPPAPHAGAMEQYHFAKGARSVSLFFSPHVLPRSQGAQSPDLKYAASLVRGARNGILTLMLDPGWKDSLAEAIFKSAEQNRSLYVRGVVNSDPTIHAGSDRGELHFIHGHERVPSNYDIALPAAQKNANEPILDELARAGIVVVHSKVIVIDPLGAHPVVMTGSHNMGVKAATINDDNLVIVENDRDLAIAYAINVISTFNHFWWRHNMSTPESRPSHAPAKADKVAIGAHQSGKKGAASANAASAEWRGLRPDDSWQDKFYGTNPASLESKFWGVA